MLIDKCNKINEVQVKSTSCKTKYGVYQVALKSCGGTKGKNYKTLIDTNVDELFVCIDNLDIYIIPIQKITNRTTLNLYKKISEYKVK